VEVRLDVRSRVVLDGDRLIDKLVGPVVRAVRTNIQQRSDAKSFQELELAGVRCRAKKQVIKNIHWRSLNRNTRAVWEKVEKCDRSGLLSANLINEATEDDIEAITT
jgi:hypothetical protein